MAVNWAKELGIDVEVLHLEHFAHPDQMRLHRQIAKQGEEYWARDRMLAQAGSAEDDMAAPVPKKIRKKRAKLRPYVFTEAQLDIARRTLDAKDSM